MKVEVELVELNALHDQISSLQYAIAHQTFKGNTIEYIHQKMLNYGDQAAKYKARCDALEAELRRLLDVVCPQDACSIQNVLEGKHEA